jgi:hypothetical protein
VTKKDDPLGNLMRQDKAAAAAPSAKHDPFQPQTRGRPELNVYKMTFRIPRKTYDKLNEVARDRKTTLQDIVAAAVDLWMIQEQEGRFFPDDWQGWNPKGESK